ncbi:zeatin O-glucosyltransferase-like [Euphorbia lathyris]|uniref:zeatin O-glucosyltransferase-like n=1 Tax=Euphorbia lathyris TaxID=212925 RepID=UPI0033142D65
MNKNNEVIVVIVPFPAQGHLNQLLHLSRLILSYNLPVHFLGTALHNRQARHRLHCWDTSRSIQFHDFEIPSFPSDPPPNPNPNIKFPSQLILTFKASIHLQNPVSTLLHSLSTKARKLVIIHDSLMASVVQEVQFIPNAESYVFQSVSAFTMFFFRWDKMGRPKNDDGVIIPERVPSLEGCFPKEFLDLISSQYEFHKISSGYIYNTSRLIEGPYLDLIQKYNHGKGKHFALGPFNPVSLSSDHDQKKQHLCLEWLDKQAENSVIYVSFGTTTSMNNEQINELAIGLKESNQKFIWVLRDADKGDIFTQENEVVKVGYNENSGLIVRDWVPQLEILGHTSIGGFMSHCGWNSCMESISMGVPIAAWPMHSDQPRNSVLITECLKIGVVVRDWERRDEIVTGKMIQTCVQRLMASDEGFRMRKRASELGHSVRRSVEEGGVSRLEMNSFIAHISS